MTREKATQGGTGLPRSYGAAFDADVARQPVPPVLDPRLERRDTPC